MNVSDLDLNLLIALDALLAERSVGRAARRLGLSQPATSHALRRLRSAFGDPLLVRVGARMDLTSRALHLREPVRDVLQRVGSLLQGEVFDPATSRREFTIMVPDLVISTLMPALLQRLTAEAPHIKLKIIPWQGDTILTGEAARNVDLVIYYQGEACPGFHRISLYRDTDVLAVRSDHPVGKRLTRLRAFQSARHVAVVGRGERGDPVDEWLLQNGVSRDVVLVVPSYLQALQIVASTDLVATLPSRLVTSLGKLLSVRAVRPPLDPGWDEQFLFYPTRLNGDPASVWLRKLITGIARHPRPAG